MPSVNKVILIGNLGRDPEKRSTPSGATVCNITIATSRQWKDKQSGEKQEETEWHRVVLYDKVGDIAAEYLKKGRPVYIEGRLQTKKWQDKDGQDRYTTQIVAEQMQMLGGREDGGHPAQQRSQTAPASRGNSYADAKSGRTAPPQTGGGFDNMDDDIPF